MALHLGRVRFRISSLFTKHRKEHRGTLTVLKFLGHRKVSERDNKLTLLMDTVKLLGLIKKAAVEAVETTNPTEIRYGKVISVNPLQISVEDKMTFTEMQLVLTRNVKDNVLQVDEKVLLLREQGGQKYIVLDRL